jgi:hypothetical protein
MSLSLRGTFCMVMGDVRVERMPQGVSPTYDQSRLEDERAVPRERGSGLW